MIGRFLRSWAAGLLSQDEVVPGFGFGSGGDAVSSRRHLYGDGASLSCHVGW